MASVIPVLFMSVAYCVSSLYPIQSSLYVGRYHASLLTDSSGWLFRIGYDEYRPAYVFSPPGEVTVPNSQMIDMIAKGCHDYGREVLGLGYYSIRNDTFSPDADILTMRHALVIPLCLIALALAFFIHRCFRDRKSNSTMA